MHMIKRGSVWKGTTGDPLSFISPFARWMSACTILIRHFPQDGSSEDINIYIYISCLNVCVLIKLEGRNVLCEVVANDQLSPP